MNKAFIFPGQGSQIIGMGKDLYDLFPIAKETFEQVDDAINKNLSSIIFNGPENELTLTVNAQPALMVVSLAFVRVILSESSKPISEHCRFVAGHSLGEYSALCAAGVINLQDTAKLLEVRSSSMQEACPPEVGGMAACIGIGLDLLEDILSNSIDKGVCQIANDNTDSQIVISGHNENIDRVIAILNDMGFKAIKLKVSAPFHSILMKSSEVKMAIALSDLKLQIPKIPIIQNVTAELEYDPIKIKNNLIDQICGRVRWRETIDKLAELGVSELLEIGAGRVLTGMAKKTSHQFKLTNISNIKELEEYLKVI